VCGRFGFGLSYRNKRIEIAKIFVRKAVHFRPSREIEMPNTWTEPTRRGASGTFRPTDSAARKLVRQMKNPEARHKALTPHHTARMFTPLLKRVILSRAKRPRTAPTPPAEANS
jgi:hypothetical protein